MLSYTFRRHLAAFYSYLSKLCPLDEKGMNIIGHYGALPRLHFFASTLFGVQWPYHYNIS